MAGRASARLLRGGPVVVALVLLLAQPHRASAQGTTGPVVTDSKVGYIDNAIPGDLLRLRSDFASHFPSPARAEFFYAATAPRGPGLPLPERNVNYQELSLYAECVVAPRLSVFADLPFRVLDPEVNANHAGLSDVSGGFKYAFLQAECSVASFQLTVDAPSGAVGSGLGTGHVSFDSAALFYQGIGERLGVSGELHLWVPVGGSAFAGNVVRYGLGAQYEVYRADHVRLAPVVEFVGWTVLSGMESVPLASGASTVRSASGDTIVNGKFGMRMGLGDRADIYAGYGHALTGVRWYQDIVRVELRFRY